MKAVLVIATWSSGSTAVTGYLDRCGAYSCPPHFKTNDARTPVAYEPQAYRAALARLIDPLSLKQVGDPKDFAAFFDAWWPGECAKAAKLGLGHVLLKHPLQTFVLPYLHRKLAPSYVFVTRPFEDIERTRTRRKWHQVHGAAGAKVLYSMSYNFLVANSCPFIPVPFNHFRADRAFRRKVLDFIELAPSVEQIQDAEAFLRA